MGNVRSSQAAEYCNGRLYGPDVQLCRPWKIDSRDIAPGDAFVALKGEHTDGHLYVHQAIERGAKLLLVEIAEADKLSLEHAEFAGVTVIAVPDTAAGLAQIARMYLKEVSPHVIGITGSVGKTTTRELTVSVLGGSRKIHSAIRSFNTVIGCSLTILSMPPETEILILEFGTNHFGEIKEMVSLFPPDTAVITEVAPAHLEGFSSIEGVLQAKLEICTSEKLKCLIYNADNGLLNKHLTSGYGNVEKIGVGHDKKAGLVIGRVNILLEEAGAKIDVRYLFNGDKVSIEASLFGMQHAYNIGYAYVIGRHFSISDEDIVKRLSEFRAIAGRGICKRLPGNTWIIDEAYNANPSSMRAAIENVINISASQKFKMFAVLGGMKELGESSASWHDLTVSMTGGFEKVILLGCEWFDASVTLHANCERYMNFEDVTSLIQKLDITSSIMLIKGSNSYGLKRLVALLTEGSDVY